MPPMPTRWWLRPVSSAARVGEHTAVTWNRLYVTPCCCTRVRFGVRMSPPNVSGPPKPASSISTISTFGASSGAFTGATMLQSPTDSSIVSPATPENDFSLIGSTVRSGANLPIASPRARLSSSMPPSSDSTTDFSGDPGRACSTTRRCSAGNTPMITAVPGLRFSADLLLDRLGHLAARELPDDRAGGGTDSHRRQQRRGEQADQHAHATAPTRTLAAQVVAGVGDDDLPVGVLGDQDHPLGADLLGR